MFDESLKAVSQLIETLLRSGAVSHLLEDSRMADSFSRPLQRGLVPLHSIKDTERAYLSS